MRPLVDTVSALAAAARWNLGLRNLAGGVVVSGGVGKRVGGLIWRATPC
jgi:hypothetical protein